MGEKKRTTARKPLRRRSRLARRHFLGYCGVCGRDVESDFCDHCGRYTQPPEPVRKPLKRKTTLKVRGRPRFKKGRDPEYLAWIRTLVCRVCGRRTAIEAAHIRSRGAGGVDRGNVVPLCGGPDGHHTEQHQIGIRGFQTKYGLDLAAVARALTQRYEREQPDA